ncbi:hypothetical protein KBB68_03110 [Candidatus Babeliales bacterium]|nr:hypothetical protein [Candidatus Babeliales bacterium]
MYKKNSFFYLALITFLNLYGANNTNNTLNIRQHDPYKSTEPSNQDFEDLKTNEQTLLQKRKKQIQKINRFQETLPIATKLQALPSNVKVRTASNISLKTIENIQREIIESIETNKNLDKIINLQSQNSEIFASAMTPHFRKQALSRIMERFRILSSDVQTTTIENVIKIFLQHFTQSELEEIDPITGQNIVHKLTPAHWLKESMTLLATKSRLDIPTIAPDIHVGSTIFHSVAYQIYKKSNNLNVEHFNIHIRKSVDFLITNFNNGYAPVLIRRSYPAHSKMDTCTCWQLLPTKYQEEVYKALTTEAIIQIHNEIKEQETNNSILPEIADDLRKRFSLKI